MDKLVACQRLISPGVIAILRSPSGVNLTGAARALLAGGITAIEVTMTTPNALDAIRETVRELGDQIIMGVGSVLDAETCRAALLAGAQFVVTPTVRPSVIEQCLRYGVPIASGAMTPTEALAAHEAGSDFVKLFPAELLGPGYVKSLLAPLPMLRVIPTGGVVPANVPDYFAAGCAAVGAGSQLVSEASLVAGDFSKITRLAMEYVAAARKTGRV